MSVSYKEPFSVSVGCETDHKAKKQIATFPLNLAKHWGHADVQSPEHSSPPLDKGLAVWPSSRACVSFIFQSQGHLSVLAAYAANFTQKQGPVAGEVPIPPAHCVCGHREDPEGHQHHLGVHSRLPLSFPC